MTFIRPLLSGHSYGVAVMMLRPRCRPGQARPGLAWLAAAVALLTPIGAALAQGLTVLPVTIVMSPGQMAATLTIINQGDADAAFQVRAFSWKQQGDVDQLAPTDELLASPPLGTMAAGATQVIRLVLRHPPTTIEASYRILLDQIPPPAAPGMVRIALRLSIPVFAEPATRIETDLAWRIEGGALVASNSGSKHDVLRDITLGGTKVDGNASPYVLPGATRRWRILGPATAGMRLNAKGNGGIIDQQVGAAR